MSKAKNSVAINNHFDGREPIVREIYDHLVALLKQFGPVVEEPKKTSIHLVNRTALAGVATRKDSLILTIKSDHKLSGSRIHKTEQASARRFHQEIRLKSLADIDAELIGWLKDAYALSA